jgi:hypothetical protein
MARSNYKDPADFWREYGEKHGETVLAYALGRLVSGWDEFDLPLWGLLIATDGGFRFHHFPQESWLGTMARTAVGGDPPGEKTLFIPKERLISLEFRTEKSLLQRIFFPASPVLTIRYTAEGSTEAGGEAELAAETDKAAAAIAEKLSGLINGL